MKLKTILKHPGPRFILRTHMLSLKCPVTNVPSGSCAAFFPKKINKPRFCGAGSHVRCRNQRCPQKTSGLSYSGWTLWDAPRPNLRGCLCLIFILTGVQFVIAFHKKGVICMKQGKPRVSAWKIIAVWQRSDALNPGFPACKFKIPP